MPFSARMIIVFCLLGIAHPASAALYVSDQLFGAVYKSDNTGGTLSPFIANGDNGLSGAVGMMLHPTSGMLMVNSQGNGQIKLYNPDTGAFVSNFATGLYAPSGITLGQHNDILVTSFFYNSNTGLGQRIYRFDYNGNALPSVDQGTLRSVSAATIGPDNKLYAASYDNGLILRYAWDNTAQNYLLDTTLTNGIFAQGSVEPGDPNNLGNPGGLAFYNDQLLVTNLNKHNILAYDATSGAFENVFSAGNPNAFPAQISMLGNEAFVAQTNIGFGIGRYNDTGVYQGTYASVPSGIVINGGFLFTNPIPEPGTWAALAMLGGGWCLYRRRRPRVV